MQETSFTRAKFNSKAQSVGSDERVDDQIGDLIVPVDVNTNENECEINDDQKSGFLKSTPQDLFDDQIYGNQSQNSSYEADSF